jgi:hypothetical protein
MVPVWSVHVTAVPMVSVVDISFPLLFGNLVATKRTIQDSVHNATPTPLLLPNRYEGQPVRDIYDQARHLTSTDRQAQYGSPEDNLGRIAALWAAYLGKDLGAHDVAVMMALVKIGRIGSGVTVRDNYVDAVAYIGLADRLAP